MLRSISINYYLCNESLKVYCKLIFSCFRLLFVINNNPFFGKRRKKKEICFVQCNYFKVLWCLLCEEWKNDVRLWSFPVIFHPLCSLKALPVSKSYVSNIEYKKRSRGRLLFKFNPSLTVFEWPNRKNIKTPFLTRTKGIISVRRDVITYQTSINF